MNSGFPSSASKVSRNIPRFESVVAGAPSLRDEIAIQIRDRFAVIEIKIICQRNAMSDVTGATSCSMSLKARTLVRGDRDSGIMFV